MNKIDTMAGEILALFLNGSWETLKPLFAKSFVAVVLLVLGWILGRVAGGVIRKLLKKLRVDEYFRIERGIKVSEIFSVVISWLIYIVFIQSALDELGISTLSNFFGQILHLVAGLLGGTVVIIVGYIFAKYIQKQVVATKAEYSRLVGQVIFFFTLIIAVSIAFRVAGIPSQLIDNIILILVASVGLGIAIAIGLGLKDTVARVSKKYEKRL